jgi:hypothetical protein
VIVIALGYLGLRGGRLRHAQRRRFVCPELGAEVDCEIVQDVRTGQWKEVRSCSVFAAGEGIPCEQECRKVMNAGFTLPAARA